MMFFQIDKKKLVWFYLGVIALITIMFQGTAYAAEDTSNSLSDATLVSENEAIHEALYPVGDHDYYKFTATQTGTYTIQGSGMNIQYSLLNESGVELAVSKGQADHYNSIKLIYKLTSGETYYLKVQYPFDLGIGFYTIQVLPFVSLDAYSDYIKATSISLQWDRIDGYNRYNVYRADSELGPFSKITDSPKDSGSYVHFSDYSLVADKSYFYRIGLLDSSNEESLSEIVEATPRTIPKVPNQPTLRAEPISSVQINLTWNPVSNARAYHIYRATDKNGPFIKVNTYPVRSTFFSDESLVGDTTYYYKVSAENSVGEQMSEVVSAKTFVHSDDHGDDLLTATPIQENSSSQGIFGAEGDSDYFTITPSSDTNMTFFAIGNYDMQIDAYLYDGNGQVFYNEQGEGNIPFDEQLKKGETYYLKVSSRYGTTGYYTIKTVTSGFRADPVTSTQIKLDWSAVPGATSYHVYRSDDQNGPYQRLNDTPLVTNSYPDFKVIEDTTYYYKVSAMTENGEKFIDRVTSTNYSTGKILTSDYASTKTRPYYDDDNDTLDRAAVFINGSYSTAIGRSGDIDYLTYTATKSGEHHVEISGEGIKVSLLNSSGDELANNVGTQALISYPFSEGNVYYLKVQHEKEIGSGPYRLKIANQLEDPGRVFVTVMGTDRVRINSGVPDSNLYRSTSKDGDYIKINRASLLSNYYEDAGLLPNTTYYYKKSRINSFGESLSEATAVTTRPYAPTDVTAAPLSNSEIKLTWAAIPGAISYNIYKKMKEHTYAQISTIAAPATTFIQTGLNANTNYTYVVRAVNSGGEGNWSNEAMATTRTNSPESLSVSSISSSQINVKWNLVPSATSYNIYRATSPAGPFTKVNPVPVTASAFNHSGLLANTKYYFKVTAVNDNGESSASNLAAATTKPGALKKLTAGSRSSSQIGLSWERVPGAASYNIYQATSPSGRYTKMNEGPVGSTIYTLTGLRANTKYYYKVTVVNISGEGTLSAAVMATTRTSAPKSLTARSISSSQINVKWNPVAGATSYNIYRSTDYYGHYLKINTTRVTSTSYSSKGLSGNKNYYYRVKAVNSGGESDFSDPTVTMTRPLAPKVVKATTISKSQIKIKWTAVPGGITYNVYRSTSKSGPYTKINKFDLITTSFRSKGLLSRKTYYYKVCAVNNEGEGSFSPVTSARTLK
ncbi:fibronectin type III domain-containing protein [Neobacillus drentensis]|uniref:fibronectin type III domain-containing protein n=1 Tax=Neobacillus drentensis TaxID=220684 RepID=UPI002FFFE5DC